MSVLRHITVGVAGHIDHGKTALVRALTGMETDRLAEEQARGMSIVLGFAHLSLPEGEVDLIDVPGHEKFVKTMIAGASGIGALLLVVAANERVKPQTVEHLALAELLGVEKGLVVISKSDLAPTEEERERVSREVREWLRETFLQDAPLVFVSAVTGEGLDGLRAHLRGLLTQADLPSAQADAYLPVDRVFTMTGHGTVVTGTLRQGTLCVRQAVEMWPGGARAEVRGLEVHGRAVAQADAGWRTAVNLRGVKREDLERGGAMAAPGLLRPSRQLDVTLRLLPTAARPVRRGQSVRLHFGTREAVARVFPLAGDEIAPGETALVQLRLDDQAFVPVRERFVVRTLSPAETVGGGVVLDAQATRHRRDDPPALARAEALARGDVSAMLRESLRAAGTQGLDVARFARDWGVASDVLDRELTAQGAVLCGGGLAVAGDVLEDLGCRARETVGRFHALHPTMPGMPREELRQKLSAGLPPSVFARALDEQIGRGLLEAEDAVVRESGFSSLERLSGTERAILDDIAEQFRRGGLKPPNLPDVLGTDRRKKTLYHFLLRTGALVAAVDRTNNRTVTFHCDAVAEAARLLRENLGADGGLAMSELTALLHTSRKNSIPLLEYLDAVGVTRRVGDLRVLAEEGPLPRPLPEAGRGACDGQ